MKVNKKLTIPEKNILIIGNRSYKNLGDELILLGTLKLLLEQDKNITIAAYDTQRLKIFFKQFIDISTITFVSEIPKGFRSWIKYIRQGKFKERKLGKKLDAVIIGGGEIITEENPNSYRYQLASLLPVFNKPRYLMGGIQLPKKRYNRFLFTKILKKTKHIFARDTETVDEIKKYGYENVEFFMDTSFFAYPRKKIQNAECRMQNKKKYIVINLNKNGENFLPELIEDVQHRYKKGYEILYVPIAKGNKHHYQDREYAHKIQQGANIKDQRFNILDREENFDQFIKKLAGASIVISSRLHLFLIASFLGLETKVYPYQKKILKMKKIVENIK